jgi:hypothetical protein
MNICLYGVFYCGVTTYRGACQSQADEIGLDVKLGDGE